MSRYVLRQLASGQHEQWLSGCTFIDATLYSHQSRLVLAFDIRFKHHQNDMRPSKVALYMLERDMFGLFVERKLYVEPKELGTPLRVDDLKALNALERGQLRRLCVLLSMSVRATVQEQTGNRKFSVRLHCLTPDACDPWEGLRNYYSTSRRAARDIELARREAAKRGEAYPPAPKLIIPRKPGGSIVS